ncbi:Nicotinamide mononucleotide adenylyltransferase [hydrothermal vent metagenome]|uniref:Nicotinamide mononucleotide adenylyltransferase n=1 Tax=hydrothermal vent metagenome TaxID=652676 RepID=A0A3B1BQN2_9ZZZZ
MKNNTQNPHQKALAINLDTNKYGSIAEIGAGQETARWFFRAGGAAGTIAKTMSAYDMKFSDAIYGKSPRYVSRERISAMLNHEFHLLLERLDEYRSAERCFFSFANTVAARSFTHKTDGHGWLGVRFETQAHKPPSTIILHVNLHGKNNLQDQETLGILGINLIYAALYLNQDLDAFLLSLVDQLFSEAVEIDLIDFSGPAFSQVDNRLMALRLVQHGLSSAALFSADGKIIQIADALWRKSVLVERSRFRPPTKLTLDLLDCAQHRFTEEQNISDDEVLVLSEMTLCDLEAGKQSDIDTDDFLSRVNILCALGKHVLISNYGEFFRLAQYLFNYTKNPVAIAMGLPSLRDLFNEKYYEGLPGGILESFGRLFKHDLRLYVCPEIDSDSGELVGINELQIDSHLRHLYDYLLENNFVRDLNSINSDYLKIHSDEVLHMIRENIPGWEHAVPEKVADMIKKHAYFKGAEAKTEKN